MTNERNTKKRKLMFAFNFTWIIAAMIGMFIPLLFLTIQSMTPLSEHEQGRLLAKERLLSQDFSNLSAMEDATVEVKDSKIVVILHEKNYELILEYDKEYNLVYKHMEDTRVCARADNWIFACVVGAFVFAAAGIVLFMIITD